MRNLILLSLLSPTAALASDIEASYEAWLGGVRAAAVDGPAAPHAALPDAAITPEIAKAVAELEVDRILVRQAFTDTMAVHIVYQDLLDDGLTANEAHVYVYGFLEDDGFSVKRSPWLDVVEHCLQDGHETALTYLPGFVRMRVAPRRCEANEVEVEVTLQHVMPHEGLGDVFEVQRMEYLVAGGGPALDGHRLDLAEERARGRLEIGDDPAFQLVDYALQDRWFLFVWRSGSKLYSTQHDGTMDVMTAHESGTWTDTSDWELRPMGRMGGPQFILSGLSTDVHQGITVTGQVLVHPRNGEVALRMVEFEDNRGVCGGRVICEQTRSNWTVGQPGPSGVRDIIIERVQYIGSMTHGEEETWRYDAEQGEFKLIR